LDLIPFNAHWKYTVLDVESKIKELKRVGRMPDLVIIDYADLLSAVEKYDQHRHEQTEVYRGLKRLAMMYNVAIIK
jgi:replicative DNA helicase